jgi:hypothetical protein
MLNAMRDTVYIGDRVKFEKFSVYGFSINYPVDWKIEFNNKSERIKGHVAFKSPEGKVIFVSWGPLEEAKKSFHSCDEHANASLNNLKKIQEIEKIEIVETKPVEINLHKGRFNYVKVMGLKQGFIFSRKSFQKEIRSLHLYCELSNRFFVIYGASSDKDSEYIHTFENMLKSFRCCNVQRSTKMFTN